MRPWQHAVSSAGSLRPWSEDLAIHEFMDSSKAGCADRRHRVLLHHVDLGATLASMTFPDRIDAADIARRHVIEDLGHPVTLQDWMDCCDPDRLPSPLQRRLDLGQAGVVSMVCSRLHRALHETAAAVAEILFLPASHTRDSAEKALSVLMNSMGPTIARQIVGAPHEFIVDGTIVVCDPAWIAEAIIFTMYGRIADLGEIARCWASEPGAKDQNAH